MWDTPMSAVMNFCNVYRLTVLSFILSGLSVGLFSLAVSTDTWLTTREAVDPYLLMTEEQKDAAVAAEAASGAAHNATATQAIWLIFWTGLWRFCLHAEEMPDYVMCSPVSYEVSDTGRGQLDATTSVIIIAAARDSVAFPVAALVLSVIAVVFTGVGNIRKDCKTLVGGVTFILSGLSLAVGMIIYISAINDEVGYRVSTDTTEGAFSYAYGWSFFTAGLGFLASEIAAVVSITLFLRRNSSPEDMARIIPGLDEKIGEAWELGCSEEGGGIRGRRGEGGISVLRDMQGGSSRGGGGGEGGGEVVGGVDRGREPGRLYFTNEARGENRQFVVGRGSFRTQSVSA